MKSLKSKVLGGNIKEYKYFDYLDVELAFKEYLKFLIQDEKETSKHLNDIFNTIIPNNLENIYMIKLKEIFGDFEK